MQRLIIISMLSLALAVFCGEPAPRKTAISIQNEAFHINGAPTYEGKQFNAMKIEGLLFNSRMVQGIFDDHNPETRSRWNYPDGSWDPDRNTREFIQAMPAWRAAGLLSFTINLQGGSPTGYTSGGQPWDNSAFNPDGSLRPAYLVRLEKILDKADELGMAPIVGFFYFGQAPKMADEQAIIRGVENATDWLIEKGYSNLLIEIANETNHSTYKHEIFKSVRAHELIELVKKRSAGKVKTPAGRFLVSTSFTGGIVPPVSVVAVSDFVLLHGNGVGQPAKIATMVDSVREIKDYTPKPILFNEDDHFDFDKPDNNMRAATRSYASWGYFDYRMKDEKLNEGYQSVPVNWEISSKRKRGFFLAVARMTFSTVGVSLFGPGDASIRGTVALEGEPPRAASAKIDMSTNADCVRAHGGEVKKEEIVAKDGKLKNVVVYVKSGLEGMKFDEMTIPEATLDQKGCVFLPHVLPLIAGQKLTVRNSDALPHNVHIKPRENKEMNYSQVGLGMKNTVYFPAPELGIIVQCDVHKWMIAWVCVFEHPFFAVTDENGNFEIKGLPGGEYTFATWHESQRLNAPEDVKIRIAEAGEQKIEFTYKVKK